MAQWDSFFADIELGEDKFKTTKGSEFLIKGKGGCRLKRKLRWIMQTRMQMKQLSGFLRNIKYICKFALCWKNYGIVQRVIAQMPFEK